MGVQMHDGMVMYPAAVPKAQLTREFVEYALRNDVSSSRLQQLSPEEDETGSENITYLDAILTRYRLVFIILYACRLPNYIFGAIDNRVEDDVLPAKEDWDLEFFKSGQKREKFILIQKNFLMRPLNKKVHVAYDDKTNIFPYDLLVKLGKGSQGTAFSHVSKWNRKDIVCVKRWSKQPVPEEGSILSTLDHRHIVEFWAHTQTHRAPESGTWLRSRSATEIWANIWQTLASIQCPALSFST